jgi:hypothetical protein
MDHFDRSSPFLTVLAERHANPQIFIPLTDLVTPHHVLPTKAASRPKGPVSLFATFSRRCRGLRLFAHLWVMMLRVESRSASAMNANPPVELSREAMSIRNVCRVHRHRH